MRGGPIAVLGSSHNSFKESRVDQQRWQTSVFKMLSALPRAALAAFSAALGELPQNGNLWTYTIFGFDRAPYLTRTLMPRIAGHRLMLHRIWREDADRHCHNHPWKTARFLILSGGYVEERLVDGEIVVRTLKPGDVNEINATTFHRVRTVFANTWTLGLIGERCQDWGFLVDGELVSYQTYFAAKGHPSEIGASQA